MTRRIEFCDGCHCEVRVCVCEPDTITLPLEDVKALIETISIQCGLLTMGCGGVQHRIDIVAARIIKALATLQERMK